MINVTMVPTLYQYMSAILEYGIMNAYSFESIQERIAFSDMFRRLEQSDSSFLYERTLTQEIGLIYSNIVNDEEIKDISSKMLWLGNAYIRLFFKFHKSIYYIFLYIPIEDMVSLYPLYHEMDWTQLYDLFIERTKEATLLRKLIDKRDISINKLSQLSSISDNTIKKYCSNDEYLNKASYSHIYNLSIALKVNSNIFLKEINNYTNSDGFAFDRTDIKYRSYLALYLVSYYSNDVNEVQYQYDEENNLFKANNLVLKTMWTNPSISITINKSDDDTEIAHLIEEQSKQTPIDQRNSYILIIFAYNQISESVKPFTYLKQHGFKKIFIISQTHILCVNTDSWTKEISDDVKKAMILKAKKAVGGDFAI